MVDLAPMPFQRTTANFDNGENELLLAELAELKRMGASVEEEFKNIGNESLRTSEIKPQSTGSQNVSPNQ